MQFHKIEAILIIISSLGLVTAKPTPPTTVDISAIAYPISGTTPFVGETVQKRDNIGAIYMCKEKNWGGECMYFKTPEMLTCWNLLDPWQNVISSFGPDNPPDKAHEFACAIYSELACRGNYAMYSYPGTPDLLSHSMENKGKSFQCTYLSVELGGGLSSLEPPAARF